VFISNLVCLQSISNYMSVWRRKAIECVPKERLELIRPDATIYTAFFEILPAVHQAHLENNLEVLERIYAFAAWCFRQPQEDLWNAAGVCFYEHLGDEPQTLAAFTSWVKKEIYNDIRGLLELRLEKEDLLRLDLFYFKKS
jgi:hypothetical protein